MTELHNKEYQKTKERQEKRDEHSNQMLRLLATNPQLAMYFTDWLSEKPKIFDIVEARAIGPAKIVDQFLLHLQYLKMVPFQIYKGSQEYLEEALEKLEKESDKLVALHNKIMRKRGLYDNIIDANGNFL